MVWVRGCRCEVVGGIPCMYVDVRMYVLTYVEASVVCVQFGGDALDA